MNIRCTGHGSVFEGDSVLRAVAESGVYLLVMAKTRVSISFGGMKAVLPENTVMLCTGKKDISFGQADGFLICHWVQFDANDENDFSEQVEGLTDIPLVYEDTELIEPVMRNITSEFYSIGTSRQKILDVLLKTVVMKLGESTRPRGAFHQQSSDPHYGTLIELREKIYRNPGRKWNVDLMAADVNMSRSYFQHIYREMFGVSCMTDVINGKIEKAKEILSATGCTISQIASMCGYENEEHFMRQFKKIVGVTPTGYRNHSGGRTK